MTIGTDSQLLRVGSLTFIAVGQLLPHQLHSFHTQDYIYPIGFKVMRNYWSISGNVVDFTSFFYIMYFLNFYVIPRVFFHNFRNEQTLSLLLYDWR